jgi:hypothetical protein
MSSRWLFTRCLLLLLLSLCFKSTRYIFVRLQVIWFCGVVFDRVACPVGVLDVVILWCQFYIYYSRQVHSITSIIIFQLEFNYVAQGDVNNKGTHFMFRLKNTILICPITARLEVFAAVMMKILECWTVYSWRGKHNVLRNIGSSLLLRLLFPFAERNQNLILC